MLRTLTVAAAGLVICACVPGGPIYLGPPVVTLRGTVYSTESGAPIPRAEVCVFGADTTCIAGERDGTYRAQIKESQLLHGAVQVRFRVSGLRPAIASLDSLTPGDKVTLHCSISTRMSLGTDPIPCGPAPND